MLRFLAAFGLFDRASTVKSSSHERITLPNCHIFEICKQIEIEFLFVTEQVEPFGVSLHDSVLDPVVDHFHEVARARRAHAPPAFVRPGSKRLKIGASRFTTSASPPTIML